jgi:hypothetical protein
MAKGTVVKWEPPGSPQEARVIKVGRSAAAIISIPRTTHTAIRGGAMRGLDRANQVAGSHGEEGRENASAHHSSDYDSSHDADE